jgi:hypothetical protein
MKNKYIESSQSKYQERGGAYLRAASLQCSSNIQMAILLSSSDVLSLPCTVNLSYQQGKSKAFF